MNKSIDLNQVAGKNIEDLTTEQLCAIASEAGHDAYENALKRGSPVTELRDGKIVWVYPNGRVESLSI